MRAYAPDFKIDAVKIGNDIGVTKASKELNVASGMPCYHVL